MPPQFGTNHRKLKGNSPPLKVSDPNLEGWAGVEDMMFKNDKAQMDDYSDDIDTLLVFAALFSAVVTAFAAQTYQQLQASDSGTTNQLLAYQIKAHPGTQPIMPPALNSTVFTLVDSSTFSPTTSARWINILFFFSLVLSLAAALFGILAKQWIREYLKWNTAIGDPRENVLVRQLRYEAWKDWNVEGLLWSIPFLLELAMIFFLVGVVILLWTLDSVVAITVTALVAVFLAGVSALTVLPVLSKRCPYKSPTAWVLLRMIWLIRSGILTLAESATRSMGRFLWWRRNLTWFGLLRWLLLYPLRVCKTYRLDIMRRTVEAWKTIRGTAAGWYKSLRRRVRTLSLSGITVKVASDVLKAWSRSIRSVRGDLGPFVRWQDRDIDSCRICSFSGRSWPWNSAAALDAARREIRKAKTPLRLVQADAAPPEDDDDWELDLILLQATLKDIRETSVLVRALEWVRSASQDVRVARYIEESAASIHPATKDPDDAHTVRSLADWCLFTSMQTRAEGGHPPHLVLAAETPEASMTLFNVRHRVKAPLVPITFMRQGLLAPDPRHGENFEWIPRRQPAFDQVLVADFRDAVAYVQDPSSQKVSPVGPTQGGHLRRIRELMSGPMAYSHCSRFFGTLLGECPRLTLLGREEYLPSLQTLLCGERLTSQLDLEAPGLRCRAFHIALCVAQVTVDQEGTLVIAEGSTSVADIESILLSYFGRDTHLRSADDFYMLVISAREWLQHLEPSTVPSDDLKTMMYGISKAVRIMVNGLGANGFQDVMYPPLPPKSSLSNLWKLDYTLMRDPFHGYGDNIWRVLLHQKVPIDAPLRKTDDFLTFGPLLHVIAEGFRNQIYFVAEEWPEYLHSALEEVHTRGGCSDESCPWASHKYEHHKHKDCPLLAKESPEEPNANLSILSHDGRGSPSIPCTHPPESLVSHHTSSSRPGGTARLGPPYIDRHSERDRGFPLD